MMIRTPWKGLAPALALCCAAAMGACERGAHVQPTVSRAVLTTPASSPEAFINTDFSTCGQPLGENPNPAPANAAQLAAALHGVHVGTRTVQNGASLFPELVPGNEPLGHYVMIFDMNTGQGMVYEERAASFTENAFARLFPPPAEGAPGIANFYCGGVRYSAFRDDFVKVSNDPAAGLRALRQVSGVQFGDQSIRDAWTAFHQSGFFSVPRQQHYVTVAYYDVTVGTARPAGSTHDQVRWDMVARYRGSASTGDGEPITGTEGGFYQPVQMADGRIFLVGGQTEVACNGVLTDKGGNYLYDETASPTTDVLYTKVVVGPFRAPATTSSGG